MDKVCSSEESPSNIQDFFAARGIEVEETTTRLTFKGANTTHLPVSLPCLNLRVLLAAEEQKQVHEPGPSCPPFSTAQPFFPDVDSLLSQPLSNTTTDYGDGFWGETNLHGETYVRVKFGKKKCHSALKKLQDKYPFGRTVATQNGFLFVYGRYHGASLGVCPPLSKRVFHRERFPCPEVSPLLPHQEIFRVNHNEGVSQRLPSLTIDKGGFLAYGWVKSHIRKECGNYEKDENLTYRVTKFIDNLFNLYERDGPIIPLHVMYLADQASRVGLRPRWPLFVSFLAKVTRAFRLNRAGYFVMVEYN